MEVTALISQTDQLRQKSERKAKMKFNTHHDRDDPPPNDFHEVYT